MKEKFVLKVPKDDGSMESYLNDKNIYLFPSKKNKKVVVKLNKVGTLDSPSVVYQELSPYPNRRRMKKNYKLIHKMRKNPRAYFNFGFNMKDYALFLNKHFYMAHEKKIIFLKLQKMKQQFRKKFYK